MATRHSLRSLGLYNLLLEKTGADDTTDEHLGRVHHDTQAQSEKVG